VDRHRRLAELVPDAVDVPGPPCRESPGPEVELGRARAVHMMILADAALRAAEPDPRDVVVVESRPLARHPREDPGVDALVLVDQLVAP
jgi:hypothetical protein